ncbi:hypothetical protein RB195_022175 [Necator americanus]|uniref:Uncharacterized protein n=1 Tax=Necator americanus TaxID=51031 RepID=A0ABR1EE99_NECAM
MVRFQKRSHRPHHQPKIDLASLRNEECRKKFRQRVSINIGLRTRKTVERCDSFTKCIKDASKKTSLVSAPMKKFTFAFAETIPTYNSVFVARTTGDFRKGKRLGRMLCH